MVNCECFALVNYIQFLFLSSRYYLIMVQLSDYAKNLKGEEKARYMAKIADLEEDPYLLAGSSDIRQFPNTSYIDILQYLVLKKSAYTNEQFKAYKSLDAYKNYRSGFLKSLEVYRNGNLCVLLSQVTHSQRLRSPRTKTWVLCKASGEILCAHCDCIAGLGEVCSHVGATLFATEDRVRSHYENESVTDSAAYWKLPSGDLGRMSSVEDIQYKDWEDEGSSSSEDLPDIPEPSEEEQVAFLESLMNTDNPPVVALMYESLYKKFYKHKGLPALLFSEKYSTSTLEELIKIGESIAHKIVDVHRIEELTRGQHKNKLWHKIREGRITASNFKAACHANITNPGISLIKRICYPQLVSFSSKQTFYGCTHEKTALEQYENYMKQHHTNIRIKQVGMMLNNNNPWFGASPDGIVECECCGRGCVEIKCPYCAKEGDLVEEVLALKNSFLAKKDDEGIMQYSLSKKHAYFYQIQMQIFISSGNYCDFFAWNKKQSFYERITADQQFWAENSEKASEYHKRVIMPELLGKFYTEKK